MTILEWVAVGSLALNAAMAIIALKIKADVLASGIALERRIDKGDAELRESQREVELYMRDNFVRQTMFDQVIKLMATNMQAQFDRLQAGIDKLSDKLDRQVNGQGVVK